MKFTVCPRCGKTISAETGACTACLEGKTPPDRIRLSRLIRWALRKA